MVQIVKQFLNKTTSYEIPPLLHNNLITESDIDKCNVLNECFANQSSINDTNAHVPHLTHPTHALLDNFEISTTDISDAISVLNPSKAPGPDGISPRLIKEARRELLIPLKHIFNMSLRNHVFPDCWKNANVVPIFKNKGDPSDPTNYRPVSLLNVFSKVMEKCIHKHVFNYFLEHRIISPVQSGFMSGDSTVNQLLYVYDFICKSLDEGSEVRIIFCDISKAFDRVWHGGLLYKLSEYGISGTLLHWFENYLSNRRQRVCTGGVFSDWKVVKAGVPQGSVLGPLLILVYINDIVHNINANIRLFADDTSIFLRVDNPIGAANELNEDLRTINRWAQQWLVSFNPSKTESLLISKKRNKPQHPPVYFSNTIINEVTEHKHLGIIFSDNGQWNKHIQYIAETTRKRLAILRSQQFKLDRISLERVYISFIRPVLEYGDILWNNCSDDMKQLLESLHLEAGRIIIGATKYCNTDKILKELGWETLQKRRDNHKLSMYYRMVNNTTPSFLSDLVPLQVRDVSRYPLRNANDFIGITSRTNTYNHSFIPDTARKWNSLDINVRTLPTLSRFRSAIKSSIEFPPLHFKHQQTDRPAQIYHTRLRLGCSSLNHDLFRRNLVPSPRCSCGQVETIEHYLLNCNKYNDLRNRYINSLPFPRTVQSLTRGLDGHSNQMNNAIFKNVQHYIIKTQRFSFTAI